MIINYKREDPKIFDYFQSIFFDLLLLIFSMITIEGVKYISYNDLTIILSFIVVFSVLQLINISVNMNGDRPVIDKLTNQITSVNRSIGFVPIVFVIFGIPTGIYPLFFGAFVFSNGFNMLIHLGSKQKNYLEITTKVSSERVTIYTKSSLMLQSGSWKEEITNPTKIDFRVMEFNYRFGFATPVFYNKETYQKLTENYHHISNNKEYLLHFLNSDKNGSEIKIDENDEVYFIGQTHDLKEISRVISELRTFIPAQFCMFTNNVN